jgi:hypothetical protein
LSKEGFVLPQLVPVSLNEAAVHRLFDVHYNFQDEDYTTSFWQLLESYLSVGCEIQPCPSKIINLLSGGTIMNAEVPNLAFPYS